MSPSHSESTAEQQANPLVSDDQRLVDFSLPHNWWSIGLGISLAGGAYPVVASAIYLTVGVVVVLWRQDSELSELPGFDGLAGLAAMLTVQLVLGGVFGMVWAAVVSLLVLPLVHLVVRSMRLRVDSVWLAAFSGGLVGFVAVLPMMLPMLWRMPVLDRAGGVWAILAILAFGPGTTTILGQLGGAWGALHNQKLEAEHHRRRYLIATGQWLKPPADGEAETDGLSAGDRSAKFQFSIRHLMWTAVWLSLLLSVIRLSGIPFALVLPLLIGWLIYQAATLWAGRSVLRRRASWRRAAR